MTREYALNSPRSVSIKTLKKNSCSFKLLTITAFALLTPIIYFIFINTAEIYEDSTDDFVIKSIPKYYEHLERIDPDETDVFHGFRTSFLPQEEIVLARRKTSQPRYYDGNESAFLIWSGSEDQELRSRVKRMGYYQSGKVGHHQHDDDTGEYDGDENEKDMDDEYDSSNSKEYESQESFERYSVDPPNTHVDRGPFDDVVEQVRGQPELEEGEMGSVATLYKHAKPYTGIHAFWKGQGDRETIRLTQAKIMKQYMDTGANPCDDFYQYACGNWATLNPIPADKAGYDTFEMLRENLDSVLKDLLEFKENEKIATSYPGPHLILEDNCLDNILPINISKTRYTWSISLRRGDRSDESADSADSSLRETENATFGNKSEKLERIRRYLDKLSQGPDNITQRSRISKSILQKWHKSKVLQLLLKRHALQKRRRSPRIAHVKQSDGLYKNNRFSNEIISNKRKRSADFETFEATVTRKVIDPAEGDAALKARFLFQSCMNYEILEKRGHQPLLDLLNMLGGWPILNNTWDSTNFDWLELMAKLRLFNNDILISEWVGPDIKNSDEFVIQFDQTSLGLPTREYFLQDANRVYLEAYRKYLVKIALLLGGEKMHVTNSANELITFETKLAKITSAPEDRKNVSELYRRMSLRKLEDLVPQVKWRRYLCVVMNRTVQSKETVVLFALSYVRHLVDLINDTNPAVLANYLLWRFVRHRVNNLDDRFQSAKQQFYFMLFGRERAPPRWKNCISQVNANMGMALGSMFVKKYFDETSKNDTLTMTREIQKSFKELLHMTDWIDDKTKKLAAHKVDAMMLRIGYPDFILNKKELDERYKEVIIHPDKYFENILNILQHLTKMEQSRIGQPVNKTLWNTAPAVVNAYYSRNKNQIMFPAGILQPPFYHRHFPRSLNYGGIGVVIGHEITHGFDDKGRLFDCDGNLHRWWSDTAIETFHRRAQCLIDQYSTYLVPEVNIKVDGVNTQGENIADNGGIKQAFRAYLRWLKQNSAKDETLPGLNHTHTQLFFLNFAQVWCGAMRPEAMRNKLKTAVHSPGRFRVVGTLSNSHDFAREFQCPPGSRMNPIFKCSVW